MLFQMAPVVVTWNYLEIPCPWSPVTNLIGMGFTVPHGTVPLVVIVIARIVVNWGQNSLIFEDISMKLVGRWSWA